MFSFDVLGFGLSFLALLMVPSVFRKYFLWNVSFSMFSCAVLWFSLSELALLVFLSVFYGVFRLNCMIWDFWFYSFVVKLVSASVVGALMVILLLLVFQSVFRKFFV